MHTIRSRKSSFEMFCEGSKHKYDINTQKRAQIQDPNTSLFIVKVMNGLFAIMVI